MLAGWRGSSDGSDHGFRYSSWAAPDGVIATASMSESLCDATGLLIPGQAAHRSGMMPPTKSEMMPPTIPR